MNTQMHENDWNAVRYDNAINKYENAKIRWQNA